MSMGKASCAAAPMVQGGDLLNTLVSTPREDRAGWSPRYWILRGES